MKTAQISIEFLFALGVLFLIFIVLWLFSITQHGRYIRTNQYLELKDECTKIANLITTTYLSGATTGTKINYDFFINNVSRNIFIDDIACSMPISRVTSGSYTKGHYIISNTNGMVEVRNG